MTTSASTTVLFHIDMDAFYASIEQRDQPSLKGRPVIVGGLGERGVVSTASYEARPYGVHSAMPMFQAKRRCPHAVFLKPRMQQYAAVSAQLMEILADFTPTVEKLSLDEAFMDMSGTFHLLGPPLDVAHRLLDRVNDELHLTASIGIASRKFIAKIASDLKKPAGITQCLPGQEQEFLRPLPVEKLWGIGPKAAQKLREANIKTIGDIASCSMTTLEMLLGQKHGEHAWNLSQGIDARLVEPRRQRKSLGAERTLGENIQGREAVRAVLLPLADEIARSLVREGFRAGGLRLKLKYADFRTVTKQHQLKTPLCNRNGLWRALEALMDESDLSRPIRLVGASAYQLTTEIDPFQPSLFEAEEAAKDGLDHTLEGIRDRFGRHAVQRGSSFKS